jgi:hypothetical protein
MEGCDDDKNIALIDDIKIIKKWYKDLLNTKEKVEGYKKTYINPLWDIKLTNKYYILLKIF